MATIPDEARKQHNKKCKGCWRREQFAKRLDMHFDWIDCPFDCNNDYEHYINEVEE